MPAELRVSDWSDISNQWVQYLVSVIFLCFRSVFCCCYVRPVTSEKTDFIWGFNLQIELNILVRESRRIFLRGLNCAICVWEQFVTQHKGRVVRWSSKEHLRKVCFWSKKRACVWHMTRACVFKNNRWSVCDSHGRTWTKKVFVVRSRCYATDDRRTDRVMGAFCLRCLVWDTHNL